MRAFLLILHGPRGTRPPTHPGIVIKLFEGKKMNRVIRILGEAQEIKSVSGETLGLCNSVSDAILLCLQIAEVKWTRSTLADMLGIDRGQLSKAIAGKKYNFPPDKLAPLMLLCGNYAPLQQILKEMGIRPDAIEIALQLKK